MEIQKQIDAAREVMESFDQGGGMTIGFDEPFYTLSAEQMIIIAGALYLADCKIAELAESQCKC